jgi:hypothetical protein
VGAESLRPHLLGRHVGNRAGLPGWSGAPHHAPRLRWPRRVTKILAGLMSRCTMPSLFAASSAPAILCLSVAPSRNSMTMKARPRSSPDVVERADVGMVQRRCGARFRAKPLENERFAADIVRQELQRDEAPQAAVFGFVNHAHAATAEFFHDAVVADARVDDITRIRTGASPMIWWTSGVVNTVWQTLERPAGTWPFATLWRRRDESSHTLHFYGSSQ